MLLVTGATGETGRYTVRHLLEKGHTARAMVHKEDERSQTLRNWGAEIVVGDLLNHDDAIRATSGTSAAYFCYPVRPDSSKQRLTLPTLANGRVSASL
jgi:NAD(P)H dehydrogenase (quinone)